MKLNFKYSITLTLSNMPAGLYFVYRYFSFTFTLNLLTATHLHNDTVYLDPSMTLWPSSTVCWNVILHIPSGIWFQHQRSLNSSSCSRKGHKKLTGFGLHIPFDAKDSHEINAAFANKVDYLLDILWLKLVFRYLRGWIVAGCISLKSNWSCN